MSTQLHASIQRHAKTAAALLLIVSVGCMGEFDGLNFGDTQDSADTGGSPNDTDGDTGSWDQVAPSWWSLEATVLIEEALPVIEDTTLVAALVSEDADPDVPICTTTFLPAAMEDAPSPDPIIYHWWQLELTSSEGDCSVPQMGWFPDTLEIGIEQFAIGRVVISDQNSVR